MGKYVSCPPITISGYSYDAAGNLLTDGFNSYEYDAENRVISVDNWTFQYVYDGDGQRVVKSQSGTGPNREKFYYYGTDGKVRHEDADEGGNGNADMTYFNGQMTARYNEDGNVGVTQASYPVYDHLGTERMVVDGFGNVLSDEDFYPFGGEQQQYITSTPGQYAGYGAPPQLDPYKFTGKERDAESGLDYFGARYYGSSMGRFTSPDSSDGPDTVPYARWANPQTLNLYSYGLNNPLSHVDPDGHDVQICSNSSATCTVVSDAAWNAARQQIAAGNSGGVTTDGKGFEGTGTILCGGSACGSATYFEPGLKDESMSTVMLFLPVEKLAAPVLGKVGGFVAGMFGRAAVAGAESAAFKIAGREMPAWVQSGGAFVSWLKQLAHDGVQLSAADADAVAAKAADFHVDVRLDPPHPGLYESPHLNIGKEGQVHLDVPQGYDHPTLPKGSARGPG